jgi:flagellar protein FlaG
MALGAISGGGYSSETAGISQTVKKDTDYTQGTETVDLNITETPAASESNSAENKSESEQNKGQKDRSVSAKQIKDAISKANSKMRLTRCEFAYHEETKRISIKVIDKDTDKVIREIPPEETLEMLQKMWEMAGLLVDERR